MLKGIYEMYANLNDFFPERNFSGMLDVNASTETAYPVTNVNSMNKKLEAAKKWLRESKKCI